MEDKNLTVAADAENAAAELLTDDASAVEEVSIEDLVAGLADNEGDETVDNEGANDPVEPAEQKGKQPENKGTKDKFSRRISAALKNQEGQLIHELGRGKYTREQIMEAVDEHLARKMHEEDAEISPKAAKKIIEAEAKAVSPTANPQVEAIKEGMKGLIDDGWTPEELQEFVADETVREDIAAGKTVRQAARAYERRQRTQPAAAPKAERKRAVPTIKSASLPAENINEDYIDDMTPEQFAAFRAKVNKARMQGKRVRL